MPLRYKVGDKVRIKCGLRDGCRASDGVNFVSDMEKYCGRIDTIKKVIDYDFDDRVRYVLEGNSWKWSGEWFENINHVFFEGNVLLLRNGQIRLIHDNGLYLPNGTFIETENYTDRKHNFDDNFDIVEVHRRATGNYLFDLSGEIIQEEK